MQETAQLAADLLQQLAAVIGTTVEGLWPYYIEQARLVGLESYVGAGICAVLMLVCIGVGLYCWFENEEGSALGVLMLVLLFFTVSTLLVVDGYKHRTNSEYYAVHYLMEDVGTMVQGP